MTGPQNPAGPADRPRTAEGRDGGSWERLEELYEQARALPPPARAAFVASACEGGLREELEAMLAASEADNALAIERMVADDASPASEDDPWLGQCLGPWRLTRVVGRGGMGLVYGAERSDGQYRLEVAVKLMRGGPRDRYATERFRTERQVLASLKHPNIAGLIDGALAPDGTPYLVMELVYGVPITQWCREAHLPLEERLRLFRVACDAVQHAHQALVVHRDLKPTNIFVSRDGEVKLLDFGIAKLLEPTAWGLEATETRTELRMLTPEYAAPEQKQGGAVTTATDVYALGVVLYELIAGVRPAGHATRDDAPPSSPTPPSVALREGAADASLETEAGSDGDRAAERRRLARRVRGDLDRIVLTALREEPARRYVSAGQLGEEIGRFLEGRPVLAQPDRLRYRVGKFVRRNRLAVAIGAMLAASLVAFGGVSAWQASVLAEQRRVAQLERDTSEQVVRVLVDLFQSTNPSVRPDGDRIPVGEFLQGAESRSLALLAEAPTVRARLQHVFGLIHYTRGQYAPARAALEEALAQQRAQGGPDHPASLETLQALGEVFHYGGERDRALALLEESLERHRRVFGEEDPRTARVMWALAPVVARRDAGRAEDLLQRSLVIRRARLGPHHPDVAESLASLGTLALDRGEVDRARVFYREALDVFPRPQDRRHMVAINVLGDYAVTFARADELAQAEVLQKEALALAREVIGKETLTAANLLNNLATTQATRGHPRDAEASFRESFETHRALLGPDRWQTRNVARNVGRTLELQQRYAEALPWMDRALPPGLIASEPDGAGVQRAQRAQILFRLGRRQEALAEAEAAVQALDRYQSFDAPPRRAMARVVLGRLRTEAGQPRAAEPLLSAANEWYEANGADASRRAEAACELARARLLQRDSAEERQRLAQCLPVYRAWGLAEPETVRVLDSLRLRSPVASGKP